VTNDERPTWLVAVDDDPTGCQSVSGVPLLTAWDHDTLQGAARRRAPVTFVLTNSRSMAEPAAVRVAREVGEALRSVADDEGLRLRVISRSDSTLRGHFPAEVDALAGAAALNDAVVVICPAFFEAGRYTADGIHWVARGGELIPVCRTEFAADATFGFDELTLAEWALHRGAVDVLEIGLDELTVGSPESIAPRLADVDPGGAIIVNATNYEHLRKFDAAARLAEAAGSTFVYRTGPSFVRAAAGLAAPAVADLGAPRHRPGLVVVGSHTAVTNTQIATARAEHRLECIELDAALVLDTATAAAHIGDTVRSVVHALTEGSVVLRTSRSVVPADATRSALDVSREIAEALTDTVRQVAAQTMLGWVITKGGVTSHELLTKAFEIKIAEVKGPALPGIIPVLDIDLRGEPMPYVIFPGNVGDDDALAQLLDRLVSA